MALIKRPGSKFWWTRFTLGGREIKRSTGTPNKKEAQEFEDRLRTDIWRQIKLGEKPKRTWDEAALKWLEESDKRSISKDEEILDWLSNHLTGWLLIAINRDVLDRIRRTKAEESSKATANRYMALVRAILIKASGEWEWIESPPVVPMYQIEKKEPRWIKRDEFEKIALLLPRHAEMIARFMVTTGLRLRNVTYLKWSQVDMNMRHAHIPGRLSKNKTPLPVPLNDEAFNVLKSVMGDDKVYCFTYQGKPVDRITKAWNNAVKNAGIDPVRLHDLRHTWASWHVQNGTPLHILMELGGWKSLEMVQRYAHLAPQHLADFAGNSCKFYGQNTDHGL